jgi:NADPH-dependent 2,4-dienoyl-CoA reductase/sulfur reductase-like enzyme
MPDPFVAIGGDAAGLSAASKLRREAPERDVIVLERGRWISYAHCGEPYFVKGEVDTLDDLLSLSPEAARDRGIDLRRGHEAVALDLEAGTVTVSATADADRPHAGETYEQAFGDLLVATGGSAVTDPIAGADLEGAFALHGLDDAAAIRAYLTDPESFDVADLGGEGLLDAHRAARCGARPPPASAAIVGGGYVGIEMAEALVGQGVDVHLFQRPAHLLPPFGEAVGEVAAAALRDNGVDVHLDSEVQAIEGDDYVEAITFEGGRHEVDMAVVGIGIRPNVGLLRDTAVDLAESGAVAVDAYGETTVDGVFAAGDCAEMPHVVTGESTWEPLGLTANRAGRAIGQTVANRSTGEGDPEPVGTIAGTAVVKAFEQECGRTGIIDHDRARAAGFDPVTKTITTRSRSGYYPGAAETTVSLTADAASGRLLGGAIAGADRAAVRIDTVAMALEAEMTVADLERSDLAYAPPFSPVWDPVLTAAKVLRGSL